MIVSPVVVVAVVVAEIGLDHRAAAHARRAGHHGLATAPEHLGRGASDHLALDVVQVRQDHFEESRASVPADLQVFPMRRAL